MLHARQIDSLDAISPGAWNALLTQDYPFARHEFLQALAASGCVDGDSGWRSAHLLLEDDEGHLRAAAPLYRKAHSYGEFGFDFAWAHASHQLGRHYYPKLVCAIPFTPVPGPRLLAADDTARAALARHLLTLVDAQQMSSAHVLFTNAADRAALRAAGALLRRDCHYHWRNRGYTDFEAFLATLNAKRRKEIRRERRRVAAAGIHTVMLTPQQVDTALAERIYACYARTYLMRGQAPYLTPAFFREMGYRLPDHVRYCVAFKADEAVAMALFLRSENCLYGRHWGCLAEYDSLHFETCYYAGIEFCIAHGLDRFDAGAQGEHKLRRGFEPIATYSAHSLAEPRLAQAVADFLERETEMIADYHAQQRATCAFPQAAEVAP